MFLHKSARLQDEILSKVRIYTVGFANGQSIFWRLSTYLVDNSDHLKCLSLVTSFLY